MSAFITNMAQGGANSAMGGQPSKFASSLDPNKPWEYDYTNTGNYGGGEYTVANSPNFGGQVYANGPKGYGLYSFHSGAENAKRAQQVQLQEFKNNMPHLNDILTNKAGSQISAGMDQGIHQSRQADSNRGLLYGGLHQGNEGAIHAQAAGQMAQAKSDINQGVQSTYEGMQNDAIKTGLEMQKANQAMQNSIYERALGNMMNQNKALSSLGGAAGMAGGLYLSGGNPYAGMAGAQAGSQVF